MAYSFAKYFVNVSISNIIAYMTICYTDLILVMVRFASL